MKFQLSSVLLGFAAFATAAPMPDPQDSGPTTQATDGTYKRTALLHHNIHRLNHSAPFLTWNLAMVVNAKKLAETCVFQHDTSYGSANYGQNIAAGTAPSDISSVITDGFYNNEEPNYHAYGGNPVYANLDNWGHFSQVVWKDTQSVGCYTHDCGKAGIKGLAGIAPYFTVCNYYPAGNVVSEFGTNVLKPRGMKPITPAWAPSN